MEPYSDYTEYKNETRRRHIGLIVGAVIILGLLLLMASNVGNIASQGANRVAVENLTAGFCFEYPGDDGVGRTVISIDCEEVHYAEVIGTTSLGNTEGCVDLFEAYAGVANYWETNYVLGFIELSDQRMHCYAHLGDDFAGSIRA